MTSYYFHKSDVRLYLQLSVGGLVSYLRYLFLLTHNGVQHILCCVFALFFFVFFVPYVASFSGLSVFSNVYLHVFNSVAKMTSY